MSRTTDIACHDCRKKLWIGQNEYIYTGKPELMKALEKFLMTHKFHRLEFGDFSFSGCETTDEEINSNPQSYDEVDRGI